MATLRVPLNKNIYPNQLRVQEDGQIWRHIVVKLKGEQSIPELRESTDVWQAVQHEGSLKVSRGDIVSMVSADGNEICDSRRVVKAEGGKLWLGAPLRMITLDAVSYYSDSFDAVVANGTGYSIFNIRGGHTGDRVFVSVEAAKQEIIRRRPTTVAA